MLSEKIRDVYKRQAQDLAEMLLQSHSDRLEFLPALPKEWSEGNIEGMSAEGAFDVDFEWKDYTIKSAKITDVYKRQAQPR